MTTRHEPIVCPFCGYEMTASSEMRAKSDPGPESAPKPGDAGQCEACGELFIFEREGHLRKPDEIEQAELDADIRIALLRAAWHEWQKRRKRQ